MKFFVLLLSIISAFAVASGEPIVVIVRHAEKAANDPNDPDLSASGQARAEMLARILKEAGITEIFTTEFKRTQETAAPTSKATGVAPTIVPGKDFAVFASKLRVVKGNALVVGHGNTIPDILKALGVETPVQIADNDYSQIFLVTLGGTPRLTLLHYP